jgi:hypothetical protein
MTWSPSSPLTGGAQSDLTSPTYTLTADIFPGGNGEQVAVTALGGTQTGVTTHSASSPFTISMSRPRVVKTLGPINGAGIVSNVPRNNYVVITRKGVTPLANNPTQTMMVRTEISVPAGADSYDAINIQAALSAHIGALSDQSSALGDVAQTGVL